jgi:hypothetical protein
MISPADIVNSIVTALQNIAAVTATVGGAGKISAYHDRPFEKPSMPLAILEMPQPGILVIPMAGGPGRRDGMEMLKHQSLLIIRPPRGQDGDALPSTILNGVPAIGGNTVKLLNYSIHPSCTTMDLPTWNRSSDTDGIDYLELRIVLPEIGDT